jgi:hypothetical protein
VSDTIASNNIESGIEVSPSGIGIVAGVLSKVTANNNHDGIFVGGIFGTGGKVTIVDSEASNNAGSGFVTGSVPNLSPPPGVMLRNVVSSYNGTGLFAGGDGILRVAHSVVTGNGSGVNTSAPGAIQSYGDNDIDGNTNNNTGVLTPLAQR